MKSSNRDRALRAGFGAPRALAVLLVLAGLFAPGSVVRQTAAARPPL